MNYTKAIEILDKIEDDNNNNNNNNANVKKISNVPLTGTGSPKLTQKQGQVQIINLPFKKDSKLKK